MTLGADLFGHLSFALLRLSLRMFALGYSVHPVQCLTQKRNYATFTTLRQNKTPRWQLLKLTCSLTWPQSCLLVCLCFCKGGAKVSEANATELARVQILARMHGQNQPGEYAEGEIRRAWLCRLLLRAGKGIWQERSGALPEAGEQRRKGDVGA